MDPVAELPGGDHNGDSMVRQMTTREADLARSDADDEDLRTVGEAWGMER